MSWKDSAVVWLRPLIPYVLLAVAVMLFMKYAKHIPNLWQSQPGPVTVAQPAKEIVKWRVKEVLVPGPERIVTYPKAELATALKMPELASVSGNITAAVEIQPHAGKTTAVSVLDNAGKTTILTRQEPPPFFQVKREMSAEVRYLPLGFNVMEAEVKIRPLRLGPVEIVGGAGVEVRRHDQSFGPRAYAGFEYKW